MGKKSLYSTIKIKFYFYFCHYVISDVYSPLSPKNINRIYIYISSIRNTCFPIHFGTYLNPLCAWWRSTDLLRLQRGIYRLCNLFDDGRGESTFCSIPRYSKGNRHLTLYTLYVLGTIPFGLLGFTCLRPII